MLNKKIALAALVAAPLSAFAAVPAGVQTAIEAAGTDGASVGAVVFIAIVAIFAIKLMRKAL